MATTTGVMLEDNKELAELELELEVKEETPWGGSWASSSVKEEPDWDTLFDIDLPHSQDELPNWLEQQTEVPTLEYLSTPATVEDVKVTTEGGLDYWEGGDGGLYHMTRSQGEHPAKAQQREEEQSVGLTLQAAPVLVDLGGQEGYRGPGEKLQDEILEFEMVLCNTLTPPDSPNSNRNALSFIQEFSSNELDELLAERAEEMSPEEGSGGDSSSSCGGYSPRSSSSSGPEDPEWVPECGGEDEAKGGEGGGSRKRKGGGANGGPEERKQRKKEQNRDAATRYRLKKKMEVEGILGEEKELRKVNTQLRHRLADLTKESKYLKSLMRDLYRAKGLIK